MIKILKFFIVEFVHQMADSNHSCDFYHFERHSIASTWKTSDSCPHAMAFNSIMLFPKVIPYTKLMWYVFDALHEYYQNSLQLSSSKRMMAKYVSTRYNITSSGLITVPFTM